MQLQLVDTKDAQIAELQVKVAKLERMLMELPDLI